MLAVERKRPVMEDVFMAKIDGLIDHRTARSGRISVALALFVGLGATFPAAGPTG